LATLIAARSHRLLKANVIAIDSRRYIHLGLSYFMPLKRSLKTIHLVVENSWTLFVERCRRSFLGHELMLRQCTRFVTVAVAVWAGRWNYFMGSELHVLETRDGLDHWRLR
jgi:hypothetical protein